LFLLKCYQRIKEKIKFDAVSLMLIASFFLWCFLFRGFLFEKLALVSDAIPYHGHIKFFIDNISRGVYPLWDPTRNCGVPNEFFLRRIGEFNPFFLIILILYKIGIPYNLAYLSFLAIYFFVGMIGFYHLAKCIFEDRKMAFLAYILLMFSSLGTRLFASYIILIFVPMIWFFYFLVSFTKEPKDYKLLGLTFCLMVIVTTYIPFYFFTSLLVFMLLFFIIYFSHLKPIFQRYLTFILRRKFFVCLCLMALIVSLYPGIRLYQEGKKARFVLPVRHSNSPTGNVLGVDKDRTEPGLFAHLKPEKLISNLNQIEIKVFYLPLFIYMILLLGSVMGINRRVVLLLFFAFLLFLIGSPEATSVHSFLFKHIFYFKYFRNLRFFLWIAILPALILLAVECFRTLYAFNLDSHKKKFLMLFFIFMAHLGFVFFLNAQENIILSSYLTILLSFLIFSLHISNVKVRQPVFLLLLLLLFTVSVQPMEVFHYLSKNAEKVDANYHDKEASYLRYTRPYLDFSFSRQTSYSQDEGSRENTSLQLTQKVSPLYIATHLYNLAFRRINPKLFLRYVSHKFILYDHVSDSQGREKDLATFEKYLTQNSNVMIFEPKFEEERRGALPRSDKALNPRIIDEHSSEVKILKYDMNSIKFKTNFNSSKFLIYLDNFYEGWHAFINGKETRIYNANVAFKGLYVSEGENIVSFRFGSHFDYFVKYFIMATFYISFIGIILLFLRTRQQESKLSNA